MAQHRGENVLRGHQQLRMSERFIVETQIGGALFFSLFKLQGAGADGYAIAVLEGVFELLFAVDKYLCSRCA